MTTARRLNDETRKKLIELVTLGMSCQATAQAFYEATGETVAIETVRAYRDRAKVASDHRSHNPNPGVCACCKKRRGEFPGQPWNYSGPICGGCRERIINLRQEAAWAEGQIELHAQQRRAAR